jgi:hypothetical protein
MTYRCFEKSDDVRAPCKLITQSRYHALQFNDLPPLLDNQALQFGRRQAVKILRRRHARNGSDSRSKANLISYLQWFCPSYLSLPVYLDPDLEANLLAIANARGGTLSRIADDLLMKAVATRKAGK